MANLLKAIEDEELIYELYDDYTAAVVGYDSISTADNVTPRASITYGDIEYKVTKIGPNAF